MIVALRSLGRRDVAKRLAEMEQQAKGQPKAEASCRD
jgi:hypothetical protein